MIKTHIIVDFYHADRTTLARTEELKAAIDRVLCNLDTEACNDNYIQFEPEGVTATIVTKDFHFSIHTWPEHRACAVDLYSGKDKNYASRVAEALSKELLAGEYDLKVMRNLLKRKHSAADGTYRQI
jgi:S-adenosylmethionine/arginine decarboxylase-like enzyme